MQGSPFTRFLAILFAIAFVLTTCAALLLITFDQALLNSTTYKNALATQQVYSRLPRLVAEQLVESMNANPCVDNPLRCENARPELLACFRVALGQDRFNAIASGVEPPTEAESREIQVCINQDQPDLQTAEDSPGGAPAFFKLIKASDLEKVITPLLPPVQINRLTDSFLDQLFSYLNGHQDSITLDLTGIKGDLAGPGGLITLLLIIRSQPACTFEQLEQMLVITLTGKGDLILCNPSPDLLELLTPFIQSELQAAVNLIPDTKTITPLAVQSSQNYGPFGSGVVGAIRLTLTLLRLSPLAPLFFLLLITLLVIRSVKDFLRWWGIPLFCAGLLSAALGLTGSALFEPGWVALLTGRIPTTLSLGLVGTVHDLLQAVLQTYWQGIELVGGVLALLGLGMWIISLLIQAKTGS